MQGNMSKADNVEKETLELSRMGLEPATTKISCTKLCSHTDKLYSSQVEACPYGICTVLTEPQRACMNLIIISVH